MSEVKLHLGDCLEFMKSMPDKSVDCVLTDPPYGINYNPTSGGDNSARRNLFPRIVGDDKGFDPTPFLSFNTVVLFGANNYSSMLPNSRGWVVWDKRRETKSNDMSDCELIWTNKDKPARMFWHRWMGMIRDSEMGEPRVHPSQKPVALMAWLIEMLTNPNDTIFDPFMGSGTTGVACMQTGRNFIGCEIDPTYFAIAEKRIAEAQLQVRMPI